MDNNNLGTQNPEQNPGQNPAQDPAQNDAQNNLSMLDRVAQNNPFLKFGQTNYQNIQTQSVVKSSREEANEQLAQINARNAEILRQQKLAEEAAKAKRTGIYIGLGIFFAAIFIVGGWLIVNAIIASQQSAQIAGGKQEEEKVKYGKVEGYSCKTEKCEKVTAITENEILIRDGANYYIFQTEDKKTSLTTIPEQDYHAITPFNWGGKTYAVLDPESSRSALYSITDNRQLTEFAYDSFYYDASAEQYSDMVWVEGKYIVASSAGTYRLIRIDDGREIISGAKRVFTHDDYYFTYEADGTIHIYTPEAVQFHVAKADDAIFTNGTQLVVVSAQGAYRLFEKDGKDSQNQAVRNYISQLGNQKLIDALNRNAGYYRIPANQ